jgi:hypothetical protein
MRTPTKSLVAISISSFLWLGACEGNGGGGNPDDGPDARPTDAMAPPSPDANPGAPDAAPDPAGTLWAAITGANDYKGWSPFPGHAGVRAYTGHGATHRRAFVNDTARDNLADFADGSIIVKENLTSEDPADLAAITVMQRQGSTWYWVRFMPDGTHDVAGTTDDPSAAPCVSSGCHGDMTGSRNDYVFLNNEAQDAAAVYAAITATGDEYTTWTGFGAVAPAIKPDTTFGTHGSFNRTLINDVAEGNENNLADGSILVKENLSANDATALVGITVMKKTAGIDAENEDWFYAELGPDGKVRLAGTRGANAVRCADSGCHDAVNTGGGDFVYGND